MNAKPKRYYSGAMRMIYSSDPRDGMWMECEVISPPSREGQSVDVYLDEDTCLALFLELRSQQARARKLKP